MNHLSSRLQAVVISERPQTIHFPDWRRWSLFVTAWGLVVLGAYSRNGVLDEFCERAVPVAMLVLTALTTAGCGGRIIRWLQPGTRYSRYRDGHVADAASVGADAGSIRHGVEFLCLSSAIGWAALSLVLCWIAALKLFESGIWGPLAFAASLTFGLGFDGRLSGWDIYHRIPWSGSIALYRRDWWTFAAGIVSALLIGVTFLWAWGPVWDYDSEMYHLPNAVRLIQQHQLVVDRNEPLSNLPGQAYLWYALGLSAGAEAFPALLVCWATVMTSLLAASLASRWLGVRVGLWTIPAYWSGMIVHAVASTPRVEPLYSLMFLTAFAWLFEATVGESLLRDSNRRDPGQAGIADSSSEGFESRRDSNTRQTLPWGAVVCCGVCLGTAGAIKYQGFYCWPLIGCWWIWLWCRQREWRSSDTIVRVTAMFLIGFVVLAPWWIKNYQAFGNPIYPMFNRAHLDPNSLRNANPHGPHRPHPWNYLVVDTQDLFLRPNSFSGPPNQFPHYTFLLLPLLWLVGLRSHKEIGPKGRIGPIPQQRRFIVAIALLAGGYYILSLTLTHELRHMFGMFSLASILVAHVVVEFGLRWRLKVLLPGMVVAAVAFVLLFPGRLFRLPTVLKYTAGLISDQTLREQLVPSNYSRACHWCNQNTPSDAVILLCWEARTYRLQREAITDPGGSTWMTLFRNRSTPEDVRAYLRSQGVDYVLVNAGSLEYNVNQSKLIPPKIKADFLRQRELLVPAVLEPLFEVPKGASKAVSVYRVRNSSR